MGFDEETGEIVIVRPRTIAPVPEEMAFEDSLGRRYATSPTGRPLRPEARLAGPGRAPRRCRLCRGVVATGVLVCARCLPPDAARDLDAPGDEQPAAERGEGWLMAGLTIALVVGVLLWGLQFRRSPDEVQAQDRCPAVQEADDC